MTKRHRRKSMNQTETQAMLAAMEKDNGKKGGSFWSPEKGENNIRFLPPVKTKGEVLPYFHHKVHWIDGTPLECVAQEFVDKSGNLHKAEACPACKMSKKFYKLGERDSEERDIAYDLSGKDRYVFRIVDRSKDEASITTPEFYEVGPTIYKKFFAIMKSGKYGNIVSSVKGRDFIIDKQGEGRRTNYDNSMPDPNITPIFESKEDLVSVLKSITDKPYSDLIEFPTVAEIQEAVNDFLNPEGAVEVAVTKTSTKAAPEAVVEAAVEESPAVADEANMDDIDDILSEFE